MRSLVLLVIVLPAVLAGCAEEVQRHGWAISGDFEREATQEDVADLQRRLEPWGTRAQVQESYPMQYRIEVDEGPACDEVRQMLEGRPYIATVGRCQAVA